eukprot:14047574-Heterocapsa_arctica.AAC.1
MDVRRILAVLERILALFPKLADALGHRPGLDRAVALGIDVSGLAVRVCELDVVFGRLDKRLGGIGASEGDADAGLEVETLKRRHGGL